uniref:EF-hand domain-containing protein n=1 Tax=Leptobrachium leishanense TaxID=445787 RepID=A0A8C5RD98_9ANUR
MAASDVEKALVTVVQCFYKNAKAEGKHDTLSKAEFHKLVSKETPGLVKTTSVEEKMEKLDINHDGELTFTEYWKFIGDLAREKKEEVKRKMT